MAYNTLRNAKLHIEEAGIMSKLLKDVAGKIIGQYCIQVSLVLYHCSYILFNINLFRISIIKLVLCHESSVNNKHVDI